MSARKSPKRFGAREVRGGKYEGALHVATASYANFSGQLSYLQNYLNRRHLPVEPEEATMSGIVLTLQNILESKIDELFPAYLNKSKTKKNAKLLKRLKAGYVSFKEKIDWLQEKKIISAKEYSDLDELRKARNHFAHYRSSKKRKKLLYSGKQLMTQKALQTLFTDMDSVNRKLKNILKKRDKWDIIPPGYAEEMKW